MKYGGQCLPPQTSTTTHTPSPTGKFACTLIPGDGIGAEITDSVKEIFESINVPIEWEQYDVSGETTGGEALFRQAMDSLKRNKVGLKGQSRMKTRKSDARLIPLQVSSTPRWKSVDTTHGTSPCVNPSTSTHPSSSANPSPVSPRVTRTLISLLSEKTQRVNTPGWSTRVSRVSLRT